MSYTLTIGITSYKRVNELIRCIKSIQTKYNDEIEVIVSEDNSPLSKEIQHKVEALKPTLPFLLEFKKNDINLGFDMNLESIIRKSNGEYILFMSDDDVFCENGIDSLIQTIRANKEGGVLFAPFFDADGRLCRNYKKDMFISPHEKNVSKYLYNSILFSGLVFKKELVDSISASRFKNYNYFQVYLFMNMIYKHGGIFYKIPTVKCISDGENAYGIAESSGGNPILADRTSVISNLEFNKTLIRIIKVFDSENGTHVLKRFEKKYSFRSYSGLSTARKEGKEYFKTYWKTLNSLEIKIRLIAKVYYLMLYIFGYKVCNALLWVFIKIFKR